MREWKLSNRDLKRYPHFDKYLAPSIAEKIVKDPERVRKNAFFPFLCYEKKWQPFRVRGKRPPKKVRVIRYASRRDAYIFSYYRHILSERYEELLTKHGISNCVIAYRKLPVSNDRSGGKCNIHFANDAFNSILRIKNCCVITLDISKYFESIDHAMLRDVWCRLLSVDDLPADHEHVFKAITRYAVVDRNEAYARLGYFGEIESGRNGFLVPHKEMPMQLCSPREFREKICGKLPGYSDIVKVNDENFGIPQGSPISDLLANAYLLDFDIEMSAYAGLLGGVYYRYSDDIFILVPGDEEIGSIARNYAIKSIKRFGSQLKIKKE